MLPLRPFILILLAAEMLLFPFSVGAEDWRAQLVNFVDVEEMGETAMEHLVEELTYYEEHPMDLNRATIEELTRVPFVSFELAQQIVNYRQRHGGFRSVNELALLYLHGDATALLSCLRAFLMVGELPEVTPRSTPRLRQRLVLQSSRCLNEQEGYSSDEYLQQSNKAYLGNPWHHTGRYTMSYGEHYSAGLVWDKDPGEPYNYGHWGGYLMWQDTQGALRQLCLGHYKVQLGCGLLLHQGFSLGKSMVGASIMEQRSRFSVGVSSDEYNYFQGVAARLRLGERWEVMPFVSVRSLAGVVEHDTLTSIVTDGLYQRRRDIDKRNAVYQSVYGLHTSYRGEWWQVGINGLLTYFDKTYYRPLRGYNDLYFRGHILSQMSAEYRLRLWDIDLKGETAWSGGDEFASFLVARKLWDNDWQLQASGRWWSDSYRQLFASTFGESSDVQGERGLFAQLSFPVGAMWYFALAADYFRLTRPKYGIQLPSTGYECIVRADYASPKGAVEAHFRYRLKSKEKSNTTGQYASILLQNTFRHTFDASLEWQATSWLRSKTALQTKLYSARLTGSSYGLGVSQQLVAHYRRWQSSLQCAWFDTDDYDSRLYLSERSLLYGFSIPMLYGRGLRYSATLSWRLSDSLNLSAKYALSNYADRTALSSGLNQISGNMRHDLWATLIWKR